MVTLIGHWLSTSFTKHLMGANASCVPQTLFGKTYLGIISFAWLEISSLLMFVLCNSGFCTLQRRLLQRRALNTNIGQEQYKWLHIHKHSKFIKCIENLNNNAFSHMHTCKLPLITYLSHAFHAGIFFFSLSQPWVTENLHLLLLNNIICRIASGFGWTFIHF